MSRVPEPQHTPDGPAYEGRLLAHPDEPVVDQGASFDIHTAISRRSVVGFVGAGVGVAALAACAPSSTNSSSSATASSDSSGTTTTDSDLPSAEIPDETAGPYPGDGSNGPDVLEESGIERADLTTSIDGGSAVAGVPLTFAFTVTDMVNDDAPMVGAAVYAWHCNAAGLYSMYSEGVEDETWLRGVQVTDDDGRVEFTSILPGCYTGRWTHIHFEVYPDIDSITDSENAIATSQMAFPEDVLRDVYELDDYEGSTENLDQITLDTDNVFGDDGGELQMATISGDNDSGYVATLTVRVDTSTEPTSGEVLNGGDAEGGAPEGGDGGPGGEGGEPPSGEAPSGDAPEMPSDSSSS
ncbi:intradiol ring-cleavage dioxygenase [Demequina sp. NBRC 110054]|uniref:intradiol ring-cleavage dioxygenase n=1 Tax=Demequina sp. NBRC 110054 TaxID=1570343 RepID=UPI0009FF6EC0|nr:intradiol ring-cleavage dioxygenase [Demequina sp. NBRC 110054]